MYLRVPQDPSNTPKTPETHFQKTQDFGKFFRESSSCTNKQKIAVKISKIASKNTKTPKTSPHTALDISQNMSKHLRSCPRIIAPFALQCAIDEPSAEVKTRLQTQEIVRSGACQKGGVTYRGLVSDGARACSYHLHFSIIRGRLLSTGYSVIDFGVEGYLADASFLARGGSR